MKQISLIITIVFASVLAHAQRMIYVDKSELMLYVIEEADTIFSARVCVGKNLGQKQRQGDLRTPEGEFSISQIQESAMWTHDFHDGRGVIREAYGPYFMRLKMPQWSSIGIHGTRYPESIGTRDSEGCVRLRNSDLRKLRPLVSVGMKVIISPDSI